MESLPGAVIVQPTECDDRTIFGTELFRADDAEWTIKAYLGGDFIMNIRLVGVRAAHRITHHASTTYISMESWNTLVRYPDLLKLTFRRMVHGVERLDLDCTGNPHVCDEGLSEPV